MTDDFIGVVGIVEANVAPGRFILGLAFDPADTGPNPTVYCSSSKMFHMDANNSGGKAIGGKIHAVSGSSLNIVKDIVTGLPVSDHGA